MKRKSKYFLTGGLLAVAAAAVIYTLITAGTPVETVQVHRGTIKSTVEDTGYVQPATDYQLFASQPATVARVPVEVGENVRRGQTLVVLENLDLAAQISETESRLAQVNAAAVGARAALERSRLQLEDTENNLARVHQLYESDAVTKVELEQAQLAVNTARGTWKNKIH